MRPGEGESGGCLFLTLRWKGHDSAHCSERRCCAHGKVRAVDVSLLHSTWFGGYVLEFGTCLGVNCWLRIRPPVQNGYITSSGIRGKRANGSNHQPHDAYHVRFRVPG